VVRILVTPQGTNRQQLLRFLDLNMTTVSLRANSVSPNRSFGLGASSNSQRLSIVVSQHHDCDSWNQFLASSSEEISQSRKLALLAKIIQLTKDGTICRLSRNAVKIHLNADPRHPQRTHRPRYVGEDPSQWQSFFLLLQMNSTDEKPSQ
jgi:hypothetical protein